MPLFIHEMPALLQRDVTSPRGLMIRPLASLWGIPRHAWVGILFFGWRTRDHNVAAGG